MEQLSTLEKDNINRGTVDEGILVKVDSYDPLQHRLRLSRNLSVVLNKTTGIPFHSLLKNSLSTENP
jgi:hypothetical protein